MPKYKRQLSKCPKNKLNIGKKNSIIENSEAVILCLQKVYQVASNLNSKNTQITSTNKKEIKNNDYNNSINYSINLGQLLW